LNAAIDFVHGIGLEAIHERASDLARYATDRLGNVQGLRMISARDAGLIASGIVSFGLQAVEPAVLTAHLWETARVVGRTVPDLACTRLCFHAFNTEAEADAAIAVVAEAAQHGVPDGARPSMQVEWDAMVEL
jgi:cysteine desulfurase/selenocysteine lyase